MRSNLPILAMLLLAATGCVTPDWTTREIFENPRRRPVQNPIRPVMERRTMDPVESAGANRSEVNLDSTGNDLLSKRSSVRSRPETPALIGTAAVNSTSESALRSGERAPETSNRKSVIPVNLEQSQDVQNPQDIAPEAIQAAPKSPSNMGAKWDATVLTQVPQDFVGDLGGSGNAENTTMVELATVVNAAVRYYPSIQETLALRELASGDQLAAMGQFDYKLKAMSLTMPLGFYENHRTGLSAEQPLWSGGSVYGGYRLGRGDIQPWYQERLTNEGGEFAVGMDIPLIKNRTIDDRRAELLKAEQDVLAVEPLIRQQSLDIALLATEAYWSWLAASAKRQIQQDLLQIALLRKSQIERSIELGDRPAVASIDNLRLIATRQTAVINAQRRVESSAIKLSLFYRDDAGSPVLLSAAPVADNFPQFQVRTLNAFDADAEFARQNRPELQFLANQAERLRIELEQAGNIGLPELNLVFDAAQDVGAPSSAKRDKSPLELETGVVGFWEPLQRKMLGKQQAVRGKITQLRFKRQLVGDKITAELRDARSALNAAARKYEQTRANAELARQTAENFRTSFQEGDVDLIIVNLYEEAEAAAKSDVIDSQAEYLIALAHYSVAQGELPQ